MPRLKQAAPHARPHLTTAQLGRQLRAAFEPVPIGSGDFADLLAELDRKERAAQPVAAE